MSRSPWNFVVAVGCHGELREYLEFAMEGRRRVKEQLKKLAGHDYAKTAFSYVERDTRHEVWVDVPEQPDEFDPSDEEVVAGNASATAELGAVDPGIRGDLDRRARHSRREWAG